MRLSSPRCFDAGAYGVQDLSGLGELLRRFAASTDLSDVEGFCRENERDIGEVHLPVCILVHQLDNSRELMVLHR
jgi:hypothetical protein